MAAGLDPPERVISHSHWTMGKVKMSKSRGNVVNPCAVLSTYGVDPVRYFLLKDGRLHQDGGVWMTGCQSDSLCTCGVHW